MTANQYVKSITKEIICDKKRRKDIQKQLKAEIQERMNNGEKLEDIIEDMGTVKEIAASFNETAGIVLNKSHTGKKLFKAIAPILAIMILLVALVSAMLPKSRDLSKSEKFNQETVDAAVMQTLDLLDQNDYEALQKYAREDMVSVLTEDTMNPVKDKILLNWGERVSVGKIYSVEIIQKDQHFATSQVNVVYDRVNVTYTMSFDEDMHIAGLYLK